MLQGSIRVHGLVLRPLARLARRALPLFAAATALALPWLASPASPQAARLRWLLFVLAVGAAAAALRRRDRARRTSLRSTAHGSARWGDPAALQVESGLIVGEAAGQLLRFDGEGHLLSIAPTGGGKGLGAVFPNLLDYPGAILCTDIKGENYAVTARYRRERLGQPVEALDPFGLVGGTARYNPLDLIDPGRADAYDFSRLIGSMLVVPEPGRHEPFWDDEAASLIAGVVLYVALVAAPADRHLGTVRHYLTLSEQQFAVLLDEMTATEACFGLIRRAANRIRQKEARLLSNVLSSTNRHTEMLDSPNLLRTLTASTFRLSDLKLLPHSIYLVLPPHHLRSHGRWLRLLVAAALRVLTATPGQPPRNVLFLLDEFAVLGRMEVVEEAIAYARSYGISIWMLVQDLSQLREVYRTSWETLLANTRVKQAFGTADEATAEYLSRLTGQATVRVETQNQSRGTTSGRTWLPQRQQSSAQNFGETGRRLLLPDEVRRLPAGQQLLFISGQPPLLTSRVDYLRRRELAARADPNPLYRTAGDSSRPRAW
ncbi:MAG TPA: type IV secretory system conjugative DNA transfer family protein [Thermoanaerobaculia bacterium]|nr:type IV secretory system conjugative DNA transfer family protein [Thermoanaerobaculia bacterium]